MVAPGRFHAGRVVVADIGLEDIATESHRATLGLLDLVPLRSARDTKYTAGAVLVVGGQRGMTGAACLTALAAFRADAGYVVLAVPAESLAVVESLALEPVKIGWDDDDAVEVLVGAAERARSLAIGPGLGRSEGRQALVRALLERVQLPTVVDADGLFGLEPVERSAPLVLTPHAGELARLLETESAWVDAHRLEAARTAAERFRAVVLLKGADTIVAEPGKGAIVVDLGPPGALATAGTGDVLTGVVASFLAKGLEPQLAAAAAAVAHARAAKLARPSRWADGERPARDASRCSRSLSPRCADSRRPAIPENAGVDSHPERSLFTLDLSAIRRNAETLRACCGRGRAVGGRQGERVRARRRRRRPGRARGGRLRALRRDGPGGARAPHALPDARILVMGAVGEHETRGGASRRGSSSWWPRTACPTRSRSTSSSTRAWGDGGSPSCPRPPATSSA